MIKSFSCNKTKQIFLGGSVAGIDKTIQRKAFVKLTQLNNIAQVSDLMIPPSNRLHKLIGDLKDHYSISVNMQWRITFIWKENNAHKVKLTKHYE